MEILRKSFKYSSSTTTPDHHCHPEDERFSLLDQKQTLSRSSNFEIMSAPVGADSSANNDVIININTRAGEPAPTPASSSTQLKSNADKDVAKHADIWKGSSYDFSSDLAMAAFASNSKDFDFVTESPLSQRSPLARIPEAGPTAFEKVTTDQVRRRSNASGSPGRNGSPDEVLVCSGNSSFKRRSSLLMMKTKSRLLDVPEVDRKTSMLMRSGVLSNGGEIDEEDPFFDEDLPDEYTKMKFSVLTVVEIFSLILLIAALICTVTIKFLKKRNIFQLELWKWEVMLLVLICGRLFSGWGIRIVVLLVERNFLLRKRVLYFVYGLRKAVQNCIWLTLVFVTWQCIFDKKLMKVTDGRVLPTVTNIWICLLVATLIWLVKTLLVKVLASSFHVSTFFDRIQESLFNQYVVEALSGPPLVEIQQEQEEEEKVIAEVQKLQKAGAKLPADLKQTVFKSGRVIGTPRKSPLSGDDNKTPKFSRLLSKKEEEKGISIDQLHRLSQKNISAWNMKRMINIVRKGALTTLDERLEDCDDDEASVEITSEKQAKIAAKKIFYNVAKPGAKVIQVEDLMRFMRDDEALKTMHLFEGANEGRGISKKSLKNWVVNAFRERRALALSLNDTKTAVNKLHQMLNVVVAILVVIIWLLILKVASTHFFIFMSSQLLLVVFMFGNTCKTTFEAIIFLFVMHPFDVGDRVEIDAVQMVVEEINILTTVFLRFDNQKIFYPNSILATKPISNYYRSPDMGDAIDFCVHISTPMDKIALMKERITRVVENKSDHWYPAPMIVMRDVEDMNRLKWSVWLSHTINFQDMGERWTRRALLVEEMIKIFKELDIEYRMLPHDVNVRTIPATTSTRTPSNWTVCS